MAGTIMHAKPWKVGVLFSQTGVTAASESTQRAATLLAIDQINAKGGILGRPIEPIEFDPASDPKMYKLYAEKLCDAGVRVIFGCHMSSTRRAALPTIEARGALLFYPTLYEGFEYSRHCIYTGASPSQNSVQLVRYLTKNYGSRVFMVGSNYIYAHESNRIVGELFSQSGGAVLDEIYVPLDVAKVDFNAVVKKIKHAHPDVVYSTVVGDGIAILYEAFRNAGLDPRTMPIGSLATSEAEVAQMPLGIAEGHIVAAPYFSTLATPNSLAFISAFRRKWGPTLPITAPAEAAYFQVFLFSAAAALAGTDQLQELLPKLYEIEFDAPQGRVKIEAKNNHTHLWPRVGKANARGTFDIVYDTGVRVEPDPFMLEYQLVPSEPADG
jgi:branched-chain amino acid transport system substrate-binding protein